MHTPDLNDYLPILVMFGFGIIFAGGALVASWVLGERGRKGRSKDTPYECGMPIRTQAHARFGVKFYLVAVLFILFDVEVVFMYPWALSFASDVATKDGRLLDVIGNPDVQLGLLLEAAAFVVILFLGWAYVIKKGVLEWQTED